MIKIKYFLLTTLFFIAFNCYAAIGFNYATNQYFNPRQIGGNVLWLDANDPNANGTQPANGTSIPVWLDKSLIINNAGQHTGAAQPIFNTNQINGLPGITFISTSKYMNLSTVSFPPASFGKSTFIVAKFSTLNATNYFFYLGPSTSSNAFAEAVTNTITTRQNILLDGAGIYSDDATTTLTTGTPYLFETNYPSGTSMASVNFFVNGTAPTTTSFFGGLMNTTYGTNFWLGSTSGTPPSFGIDGTINEVIIYNNSLTAAKQNLMRNYERNKWGI